MKNDALVMLKVIDFDQSLIQRLEDSLRDETEMVYKLKEADITIVKNAFLFEEESRKMLLVFVFSEGEGMYKEKYIYLGSCRREENTEDKLLFEIKKKILSELVIKNVMSYSELDLNKDFRKDSYINVEYSQSLIGQLKEILMLKPKGQIMSEKKSLHQYEERIEERYLHKYAQRNENCERLWNSEKKQEERSEFQRDRERIVNAKAFRRMVDKAQIFTSSKGDHYRTRMTHTLEVAQIARSIANSLRLNIDLTEAIALGHDLGHTPFGHQGERTLADIIAGKTEVIQLPDGMGKNPYGGFKHNFQSIRMLDKLEEKYVDHAGLDVSFQVLEGVLKHTSHLEKDCSNCKKEKNCEQRCCDYDEFIQPQIKERLYVDYDFATTLEGQTVALADEIAQRSHDIDDAFSSGLLTFAEFQEYLKLSKMKPLFQVIENTYKTVKAQEERILIDQQEMLAARVISDIIGYLVNDVVDTSKIRMQNYSETEFYCENHRLDEKLIYFSEEGEAVCLLLEKLISKRAINCLEVTRFDRNAAQVVKYLFKAYYENPKLIHSGTLRRMYIDMLQNTDNEIDFVKGDPKLVKEEFQKIIHYECWDEKGDWTEQGEEYYQKRKILIRHIADFIAGMTDSYAMNEYERLK